MSMNRNIVSILAIVVLLIGLFSVYEYGPEITSGAVGWIGAKCVKAERAEGLIEKGWCTQVSDADCEAAGKVLLECGDQENRKEIMDERRFLRYSSVS